MKFLVLLLMFLAACRVTPGFDEPPFAIWRGDALFTLGERESIQDGACWMAWHVHAECPDIVWDLDADDPTPDFSVRIKFLPPPVAGWTEQGPRISLNVEPWEPVETLAAHEFGHVFGLRHHDAPGVMNPGGSGITPVWTEADEQSCIDAGRCRP